MSVDMIPRDLRNLRACLLCSLIKTMDQFEQDGCDNCERVLHMKGEPDKVYECTRFVSISLFFMRPMFLWLVYLWVDRAGGIFYFTKRGMRKWNLFFNVLNADTT